MDIINENLIIVDGISYVTKEAEDHSCDDCCFERLSNICHNLLCCDDERDDERSVSWILKSAEAKSKKELLYEDFFENHLKNHLLYSLKQYGDSDVDIVSTWSIDECMSNVERYIRRFNNNSRTGQEKLDIIKAIDYLIRIFYKDDLKVSKSKEQMLLEEIYNSGACEIIDQDVSELLKDYIEK